MNYSSIGPHNSPSKPLWALTETHKRHSPMSLKQGSMVAPMNSPEARQILALAKKISNRIEVHKENGVYKIPAWIVPGAGSSRTVCVKGSKTKTMDVDQSGDMESGFSRLGN